MRPPSRAPGSRAPAGGRARSGARAGSTLYSIVLRGHERDHPCCWPGVLRRAPARGGPCRWGGRWRGGVGQTKATVVPRRPARARIGGVSSASEQTEQRAAAERRELQLHHRARAPHAHALVTRHAHRRRLRANRARALHHRAPTQRQILLHGPSAQGAGEKGFVENSKPFLSATIK